MKTWLISGIGLKVIEVKASSFDEALAIARKTNRNYSGGQIKEDSNGSQAKRNV